MDDIKSVARRAKRRLKTGYWSKCRAEAEEVSARARSMGLNENKVREGIYNRVRSDIRGEKPDDFYLKVKELLDSCGEVSDALGRLTDREYYNSLGYAEKQRYNLDLASRYNAALERYRREKESGL